jgi:DnaJ homolog subfamily A member 2
MYVTFEVLFPLPNSIPASQLTALEAILPPRTALPKLKEPEEVILSEVDPTRQERSASNMEEEEEHQQGGPGVQCAQQ